MTQRISFAADLHLFTRRSEAYRYGGAIRRAAQRSSAFILGGDIFDFRWSTFDAAATVDAAVCWLEELAEAHPDCHFHYVLGNHDYHPPLLERLALREGVVPNWSWHPFHLRLADSVFLHGDAARPRMTPERLLELRARGMHAAQPGRLHRRAYDLIHRTGLHRPIPYLVSPKRRIARRITRYLEQVGEGPHTGVRHIYFGHTHRRVSNYRYRGLVFHNGGAPIQGQKFRILEAVLPLEAVANRG